MSAFSDIAPALDELDDFRHPWYVCGGWAIDLFLGRVTREHEDLEVAIFREHQFALRTHYASWGAFVSEERGWRPWRGERLESPIHQLLFRPPGSGPPDDPWEPRADERQFFLDDREDGVWVCRRDSRLRRPVRELTLRSEAGIPFVVPEVQLLYKAKHCGEKDEQDLRESLPLLAGPQRTWLREALELVHPGHSWLDALA